MMRCMVLNQYNAPLVEDRRAIPSPKRNEILLKVEAAGICGTDVKITTGKLPHIITLPHVPGHEMAGTVVQVGEDVEHIEVGQRGIAYFYLACGDCHQCRTGHENVCNTITRLGFEHDGGFAEYVCLPAYGFCPIPETGDAGDYAVLTDAVLTPFHALVALGKIQPAQLLLIMGVGGLGLHALQIAKLAGAIVIAADIKEEALAVAKEFGADVVINTSTTDLVEFVADYTKGKGVDLIFEGVGLESTFVPALKTLKKSGTLLLTGYDPLKSIPLDALGMHYNEWTVIGTRLGTKDELLRLIELTHRKMLKPVIAKTYRFDEANEALDELKKGHIIGRIVLKGWK
ncbi:MAG: alcohol dehydrogenase catalytic domain-containing protein [Sphaerochaetaceae bacterium]